eukprot:sb/3469377/
MVTCDESRSLFGGKSSKGKYGSVSPSDTNWLTAPEQCLRHNLTATDTLQGISVKYSVPIELIKSANKLWTTDQLFLRDHLLIPVPRSSREVSPEPRKQQVNNNHNHLNNSNHGNHDIDHTPTNHLQPPAVLQCTARTPDEDSALADIFSRFDRVLATSRETTERIRSNSNLDHSPQVANSSLTRSLSTVSIVEPGAHGSRVNGRTRYKRGRRDFYTDDELPPSSSDEIYLL